MNMLYAYFIANNGYNRKTRRWNPIERSGIEAKRPVWFDEVPFNVRMSSAYQIPAAAVYFFCKTIKQMTVSESDFNRFRLERAEFALPVQISGFNRLFQGNPFVSIAADDMSSNGASI